jgi:23S rRNA (cytosine1962-C5)-methyltransferase
MHSAGSRIAIRMVTRDEAQPNRAFWLERVQGAVQRRARHGLLDPEGACRLIAADADGLPGLVADRYGRTLVLQCGTQGADRMRDFLVELIEEALPFELDAILDRSDTTVRKHEGLDPRVEVLRGAVDAPRVVHEEGLEFTVDVLHGHKTGAYLDQRDNRKRAALEVEGKRVLDAFSYDGLFGIRAALAGATEVVCLEQNQAACDRVVEHAARNGVSERVRVERVNCMQALRDRAAAEEQWDVVVVDPPAFARNKKEVEGAERGYVELNRRALSLLAPEGLLVSASCSHNVRSQDFTRFLASAARLAERPAWLEELSGAAFDHPHLLTLPESQYLKCAFVRVG